MGCMKLYGSFRITPGPGQVPRLLSPIVLVLVLVPVSDPVSLINDVQGNYVQQMQSFSLTLARLPMASGSYQRASDFLSYSPGLASDILAEQKSEKKRKKKIRIDKDAFQ